MRNILLTIEYDGTNYAGWQVQPNGLAIQQVLEEALERLLKEQVRLYSSGRTDAGVHAMAMPASFTTTRDIPLKAFTAGLNGLIPPDIAVKDAREVPLEFNPRREATLKHYCYSLHLGQNRSPLRRLYSWHVRGSLDVGAMRIAAGHFVGEHDFASFRGTGCAAKTTIRVVKSVTLSENGEFLQIDVKGVGFLRNMVRIMTGTLVEVGLGRRNPESILDLLRVPDRSAAGVTAPPQGLSLVEVSFGSFFAEDKKP
ncbi:tRNA pseudouridine(38-40) synthase TruA [Geobacter pelophilus]|uniref:tRNA pseudouridine synthase A n=1 Tax=Geoanaerobacter pelophilus TaxID=60036 RepID=A0AAW4LCN9_9BACT|nr:tRNA pseudouridine(38-40) synthase TruA [Geoanaerobacter pelophilus]MBT0666325.1 tRNA pseudouridine(38-40) synthase TruA [Geoanaerobacter pelophilus]